MPSVFLLALVIAFNTIPEGSTSFELKANDQTIYFTKLDQVHWVSEVVKDGKKKKNENYKIKGLSIAVGHDDHYHDINFHQFLKIRDVDSLKKLDEFNLMNNKVKINRSKKGFKLTSPHEGAVTVKWIISTIKK